MGKGLETPAQMYGREMRGCRTPDAGSWHYSRDEQNVRGREHASMVFFWIGDCKLEKDGSVSVYRDMAISCRRPGGAWH